jgi:hypothetical protein
MNSEIRCTLTRFGGFFMADLYVTISVTTK